jgi:hypothetical protein
MSDLSTKTVRRVFIIVLILLPLQYAVVGIVGLYSSEPWPTFVFPGFKSVYVYGDSYQINEYIVAVEKKDNRQLREFTPRQFFYEIPNSQLAGFLRSNLESEEDIHSTDESTRNWIHERGEELIECKAGRVQYIHKRRYMTRKGGELRVDSVVVVKTLDLTEAN